jgi:DNA-binding PadR family transcriptional regulator
MGPTPMTAAADRELYSGIIRLHILHHACQGPVYGLWIIEELARHGYRISPGTLYPMLHGMERRGWLRSVEQREGRRMRRVYRGTSRGRQTLTRARQKVRELFGELFEDELRSVFGAKRALHRGVRRSSVRSWRWT